jgi:FKBP-type peptidyl-prolyl cis-trans isomerase
MNKNIIFLSFGLLFLLVGAGIIGVILNKDSEEIITYSTSKSDTVYPANTSANTQTVPESNLQVQGASDARGSNNNSKLPGPDSFEIYEEYATSKSSLYIDLVAGRGAEAMAGDSVAVIYKGWLTNGQLFDQSRINEQGQIEAFGFEIGAGQVIPGWEQTIIGMKEGGKRRLVIPSEFGYGPNGQGSIPANSMLIFDVELYSIQKQTNQ